MSWIPNWENGYSCLLTMIIMIALRIRSYVHEAQLHHLDSTSPLVTSPTTVNLIDQLIDGLRNDSLFSSWSLDGILSSSFLLPCSLSWFSSPSYACNLILIAHELASSSSILLLFWLSLGLPSLVSPIVNIASIHRASCSTE